MIFAPNISNKTINKQFGIKSERLQQLGPNYWDVNVDVSETILICQMVKNFVEKKDPSAKCN